MAAFMSRFREEYQNGSLDRLATRLGVQGISQGGEPPNEIYNFALYDSFSIELPKPQEDATWAYRDTVVENLIAAGREREAMVYLENWVYEIWKPTVEGQVASWDPDGGDGGGGFD